MIHLWRLDHFIRLLVLLTFTVGSPILATAGTRSCSRMFILAPDWYSNPNKLWQVGQQLSTRAVKAGYWGTAWVAKLEGAIAGPKEEPMLKMRWNIDKHANPENDILAGVGRRERKMEFKPNEFYEYVYSSYKGRIDSDLIQQLQASEKALDPERQSLGLVLEPYDRIGYSEKYKNRDKLIASFRLFNGTPSIAKSDASLPFEHMMRTRGVESQTAKYLDQVRKSHPNQPIFELGKYNLDSESYYHDRARTIVEINLLEHFYRLYPKAQFYVHFASKAHIRLYERRYGLKVIETLDVNGQSEWIMMATGAEITAALAPIYGL